MTLWKKRLVFYRGCGDLQLQLKIEGDEDVDAEEEDVF